MYYPEEVIEEVRTRNDIVDIVSQYVNLKKKGANYFGLCPFHNEKSPSFSVSPSKQMYYCFGCGAGGNVISFVMEYENYTFVEAVSLGILANLMVCLAVWMSYSGRSLMDKAMIMVLPVAMFVASGFEHSIANMFMIPMGIVIRNFASPEFWTAIGSTPESFSHLTVMNFITDNLIPVTIGNIIGGGLLVGLTYWVIYLRGNDHH